MNKHPEQFRDVLPPDEVLLEPSGQFGEDLRNFRAAVHRAAERQTSEAVPLGWLNAARLRQRTGHRRLIFAWALVGTCTALLCVGTLPLLHRVTPAAAPPTAQIQTHAPADDTALLEQVDTAVSEPVPSSLAPLAELDDWTSTASTNDETPLNKPEKKNVSQ